MPNGGFSNQCPSSSHGNQGLYRFVGSQDEPSRLAFSKPRSELEQVDVHNSTWTYLVNTGCTKWFYGSHFQSRIRLTRSNWPDHPWADSGVYRVKSIGWPTPIPSNCSQSFHVMVLVDAKNRKSTDGYVGLISNSLLRHPIQISHLDIDIVCVVGLLCMVKGEGQRVKVVGMEKTHAI